MMFEMETVMAKATGDQGSEERVWIELEYPKGGDDALGEKRANLANKMLDRLGLPSEPPCKTFWWNKRKKCYCVTIDVAGGFMECADHGHWFRLSHLGRDS